MEITNQDCCNYINVNFANVIPMTEAEFRARNFVEVREVSHGVDGLRYLAGLHHVNGAEGVMGFYDFQREVSCCAGNTAPA